MKIILKIVITLFLLINPTIAKDQIKVRGIEIDIPNKENLIYLKRTENQPTAIYKVKMYVEKTDDNQFKSAVFYVDGIINFTLVNTEIGLMDIILEMIMHYLMTKIGLILFG